MRIYKEVSIETRRKISNANRGKLHIHTPETRVKLSLALMGHPVPEATRMKIAETLRNNSCWKGKKHTAETKRKQSMARKKYWDTLTPEKRTARYGGRGGISFEPYCHKFNKDLRRRVRAFFDDRCVVCGTHGSKCKNNLSVHHVEYNKAACCDGEPVHFAALCGKCHGKTGKNRMIWEAMLHRIIDEIYDGRSYYTKDEFSNYNSIPEIKSLKVHK